MIDLVEFGDFASPRCRKVRLPLADVLWTFSSQIQYTYRHFPDPGNPESWLAAVAAEAARRQGQFGAMHQALFTQRHLHTAALSSVAASLGLDTERFLRDLQDERVHDQVRLDQQTGYQLAIQTAPTLLIDGFRFHGGITQARLLPFIRQHIRRKSKAVFHTIDNHTGQVRWADDIL